MNANGNSYPVGYFSNRWSHGAYRSTVFPLDFNMAFMTARAAVLAGYLSSAVDIKSQQLLKRPMCFFRGCSKEIAKVLIMPQKFLWEDRYRQAPLRNLEDALM